MKIKLEWNHPIIIVMIVTIGLSGAVVASNPSIMQYTFHSAVDQPEWMRLSNYYELVYSPAHDNWGGTNEKWLESSIGDWFFVVPENELYAWDKSNQASGTLVASGLDPVFYQNPPTTFSNTAYVAEPDTETAAITQMAGVLEVPSQAALVLEGLTKCVLQEPSIIIRACGDRNCRQIASIPNATEVYIKEEKSGWYKITTENGITGWAATILFSECDALAYLSEETSVAQETSTVKSRYSICIHCNHYDIVGSTGDEILESMRAGAPIVDGAPMAGVTKFSWSYQTSDCSNMDNTAIKAIVDTTMPHWKGYSESSELLQEKWVLFYDALLVHENGHRQMLLDLTKENETTTKRSANCDAANKGVKENHARYREIGLSYDQETDHGRTQGADASILEGIQ